MLLFDIHEEENAAKSLLVMESLDKAQIPTLSDYWYDRLGLNFKDVLCMFRKVSFTSCNPTIFY